MRLFIAIGLDEAVKDALRRLQEDLRAYDREVRWVTRDQMHLTLVFLGEVSDDRVTPVCEATRRAADQARPFKMTLAGGGCFPPRGPARVVWVGLREPTGSLVRCQSLVAGAMESLGFPREARGFSPHLTLGRVRNDASRGALRDSVEKLRVPSLAQAVSAVRVMESQLSPSGARYTCVAEYDLGA